MEGGECPRAEGLGGGLPIGACLATGATAEALQRGDHGSTFGGNPVSCAAALAVIDVISCEGLLARVEQLGGQWKAVIAACADRLLTGVRGRGLWLGLEAAGAARRTVRKPQPGTTAARASW